ncbi:hypothetical protein C8R45DRAFT_931265 [Mycena sanguinolenta]|nr:hypothetical protein C8R45DRAFT_931265 [Mycena sanguinolenta]
MWYSKQLYEGVKVYFCQGFGIAGLRELCGFESNSGNELNRQNCATLNNRPMAGRGSICTTREEWNAVHKPHIFHVRPTFGQGSPSDMGFELDAEWPDSHRDAVLERTKDSHRQPRKSDRFFMNHQNFPPLSALKSELISGSNSNIHKPRIHRITRKRLGAPISAPFNCGFHDMNASPPHGLEAPSTSNFESAKERPTLDEFSSTRLIWSFASHHGFRVEHGISSDLLQTTHSEFFDEGLVKRITVFRKLSNELQSTYLNIFYKPGRNILIPNKVARSKTTAEAPEAI